MIVKFRYTSGIGVKIFRNTTKAYFEEHGVYPTVDAQLPLFLNRKGYVCFPEEGRNGDDQVYRCGISMTEEDATVFLLRWAYD